MEQENITKPIGGYFELELPRLKELHANAIALNSGRFCLEYILRCKKFNKVYVPYFTCDSAIEPIVKLNIPYEFYHIDYEYKIVGELCLGEKEALIYTNYWGLNADYCLQLANKYRHHLILDYTQAFFSKPIDGIDTFYSCRKFFGVTDGGYLYTDTYAEFNIEQDESISRIKPLINRIDLSPEAGYDDFHKASAAFHEMPIRKMSKFTKRMMQSIDYEAVSRRRLDNYNYLCKYLGGRHLQPGEVPMIFPYTSERGQALRKKLIANKVFVAKYWPNVDGWLNGKAVEKWMANHILPLPIDQRYDRKDMERIIGIINN